MKLLLVVLFISLATSKSYAQNILPVAKIEKLLSLDISTASDFLSESGLEYLGGDTSSFFNKNEVIKYGTRTPYQLVILLTYSKNKMSPSMVGYFCSEEELKAKKSYYISKGFRYNDSATTDELVKYFFDKIGSPFFIAFCNGYNRQTGNSSNLLQLIPR